MAISKLNPIEGGIPSGNTASRPSSPVIGDTYYNGQVEALEIYNGTSWKVSKTEGFPPDAPTISSVTDSSTSLAYSSTAGTLDVVFVPAGTGGTATQYNAYTTAGGHSSFTTVGNTVTITGLTPSTAYTVYGNAQNSSGTSTNTANASPVTPTTLPQAPTIGTATLSGTDVAVTWTLGNNGGKNLSSITITPYIGLTAQTPVNAATTSSTSYTFTGLTGGSSYTFKVKATNANGTSLESNASSSVTVPAIISGVNYLVVAGGGSGGGGYNSGGGGAGGLRSTQNNTGGGGSLESTISLTTGIVYTVTVGAGAPQSPTSLDGTRGSNSVISGTGITTITSIGGGGGGSDGDNLGTTGGSGGGNSGYVTGNGFAGTTDQGFRGGAGGQYGGGGGGGAGAVGGNGNNNDGGTGGNGVSVSITGSAVTYGGGGGGADYQGSGTNAGGSGGGGFGGGGPASGSATNGAAGTANTGGGGGAVNNYGSFKNGRPGGSGIVVIKASQNAVSTTGSPSNPSTGIYIFNGDGSITF